MTQTFRHPDILDIAKTEGKVSVDDLAERFGVSVQTIRRDLSDLAEMGKLERVHGGAILPSGTTNIAYSQRRTLNAAAKSQIAKACAATIPENCTLFMNIGTTTEAVAENLLDHQDLMVVTNNINVANILTANENCEVIVTGGALRRSDGGLIGLLASRTIEQFKFDLAVIGCSALDSDGDLLDFDIQEVGVSQTVIKQSRRTFLVADHSKFNRTAPARIASISEIDTIFTDGETPKDLDDLCSTLETTLVIAGT